MKRIKFYNIIVVNFSLSCGKDFQSTTLGLGFLFVKLTGILYESESEELIGIQLLN